MRRAYFVYIDHGTVAGKSPGGTGMIKMDVCQEYMPEIPGRIPFFTEGILQVLISSVSTCFDQYLIRSFPHNKRSDDLVCVPEMMIQRNDLYHIIMKWFN